MRVVLLVVLALAGCDRRCDEERAEIEALRAELEAERREIRAEQEKVLAEKRSGIKVDLPAGAALEIDPAAKSLVLEVPVAGDVMVAGMRVAEAELDKLLQAAYRQDQRTQVILRAEKGVPHGRVVGIMERVKAAGLTRLAIQTSGSR